ncbi:MAG: hypothetical protein KGI71_05980 [Patescibacteria group bacterium]|nr:hypothetical protein [Patescibacteria group bacterium]
MTEEHTEAQAGIDPTKGYNLKGMIDANAFPWITGSERKKYRRYASIIQADFDGENMLMAMKAHEDKRSRYFIKGRAIIKFIKVYGPGLALKNNNAHEKRNAQEDDRSSSGRSKGK